MVSIFFLHITDNRFALIWGFLILNPVHSVWIKMFEHFLWLWRFKFPGGRSRFAPNFFHFPDFFRWFSGSGHTNNVNNSRGFYVKRRAVRDWCDRSTSGSTWIIGNMVAIQEKNFLCHWIAERKGRIFFQFSKFKEIFFNSKNIYAMQ